MECPHCHSKKTQKFGFALSTLARSLAEETSAGSLVKGKPRYRCQKCHRYFQSSYEQQGYSPDVREICRKM